MGGAVNQQEPYRITWTRLAGSSGLVVSRPTAHKMMVPRCIQKHNGGKRCQRPPSTDWLTAPLHIPAKRQAGRAAAARLFDSRHFGNWLAGLQRQPRAASSVPPAGPREEGVQMRSSTAAGNPGEERYLNGPC